ncbi:unnamed protein product [Enterobius vermicularis]|uniref:Guanylate cyclase n=1 Tax=Enterobius vermicularis TaxID=51028 RepID=A0A0N4UUI2_ENTVE|nr:unnamed protein product [Enterobius vermicularis]
MFLFCFVKKKPNFTEEEIWHFWGGAVPLSTPICGFSNELCRVSSWDRFKKLLIVGILLVVTLIIVAELNSRWKISYSKLTPHNIFNKVFMVKVREVENLNRFFGLSEDGLRTLALWKYCQRGSLLVILLNNNFLSNFPHWCRLSCLISERNFIFEALQAVHSSPLKFHGHLTSKNCLLTADWKLKIGDYGLTKFRSKLLWTAPEVLRLSRGFSRDPKVDIYSYAIICSEVLTRKSPWDLENRKETAEENKTKVKPELIHLVHDCWADEAHCRPDINFICKTLRAMIEEEKENLMDRASKVLETYAEELETKVEDRTHELAEEKKRSDIVLQRMLPKLAKRSLQFTAVICQPETFESATLFLSDIVSFAKLAAKCTPLQVVGLLDSIYVKMDLIIGEYDIYKVDTFGGGYLCVSGLPETNENRHVKEIADMAIRLVSTMENFKINYLPEEHVEIRIGIHTGFLTAGVIGVTMPRYCVFGDSVAVVSTLEKSGKGNQIHISSATYSMLKDNFGGYLYEKRGEIIGNMETYWLLGYSNSPSKAPEENHVKGAMYYKYRDDKGAQIA